jgi:hypothetical protein
MALAYINKTIPIPGIENIKSENSVYGETAVTKGGVVRRHSTAILRAWTIDAEEMTKAEYDAVVTYWRSILGTATWFWIRSLGGTPETSSIMCLIDITGDEEVGFTRDGVYHCDGHNISLYVQEVSP